MMLFSLLLAIWGGPSQPPIERVTFQLAFIDGTKMHSARLHLNKLDPDRFSLACTKSPAGTIFIFWATHDSNTVFVPDDKVAYQGKHNQRFRLFPKGPKLKRQQWLELLENKDLERMGRFRIWRDGDWRFISFHGYTLRWREHKRVQKTKYSKRVLEPNLKPDTTIEKLGKMAQHWSFE